MTRLINILSVKLVSSAPFSGMTSPESDVQYVQECCKPREFHSDSRISEFSGETVILDGTVVKAGLLVSRAPRLLLLS